MTESANHIKDETIPPSSSVTTSGATQSLLDYYSAPKSDPRAFLRAWAKTSKKTLDEELHNRGILQ